MSFLVEPLVNALDQFFRRRPPLDALKWHPENVEAGKSFKVPEGKIYEAYACCESGLASFAINTTIYTPCPTLSTSAASLFASF